MSALLAPVLTAAIPTGGVVATALFTWQPTRRKRNVELWAEFDKLVGLLDNRPTDAARGAVGVVTQRAALRFIATLGRKHRVLRSAAKETLSYAETWTNADPKVKDAATDELKKRPYRRGRSYRR